MIRRDANETPFDAVKREAKGSYQWVLWVLGALFALPSVISIIQREFQFGLAPAYARMVEFYHDKLLEAAVAIHLREWPTIRDLDAATFSALRADQ